MLKLANDTHRGRAHRVSAPNEATLKCQKHSWLCLTNGAFRWKRAATAAFASIARNSFALIIHCEILFYAFSYRERSAAAWEQQTERADIYEGDFPLCVFSRTTLYIMRSVAVEEFAISARAFFACSRLSLCASEESCAHRHKRPYGMTIENE